MPCQEPGVSEEDELNEITYHIETIQRSTLPAKNRGWKTSASYRQCPDLGTTEQARSVNNEDDVVPQG